MINDNYDIISKVARKLNLPTEVCYKAWMSQFHHTKEILSRAEIDTVRIKHLGMFSVNPNLKKYRNAAKERRAELHRREETQSNSSE